MEFFKSSKAILVAEYKNEIYNYGILRFSNLPNASLTILRIFYVLPHMRQTELGDRDFCFSRSREIMMMGTRQMAKLKKINLEL